MRRPGYRRLLLGKEDPVLPGASGDRLTFLADTPPISGQTGGCLTPALYYRWPNRLTGDGLQGSGVPGWSR